MQKLTRDQLIPLEQYAKQRNDFRAKVMAHKKNRQVQIGPHATLYFEDRLTMHYQVQEMLRVERIFEEAGIEDELNAYNPMIPDGSNWKATFMIEYGDENERRIALSKMIGIEHKVWVQVVGFTKIRPVADEDLERTTEEKTSSVHFLRFEFTPEIIRAMKGGASISVGIDHPEYRHQVEKLPETVRDSLVADLG